MNSKTVSCKKNTRHGKKWGTGGFPAHFTTAALDNPGVVKIFGEQTKIFGGKGGIPDESMNGDL